MEPLKRHAASNTGRVATLLNVVAVNQFKVLASERNTEQM
jgi:phage tail sheath gpL-like